jgi:hypothetical protein
MVKSWQVSEVQIRSSVEGLKSDLQRERELSLERLYQAFVQALHFPELFKKAKWK